MFLFPKPHTYVRNNANEADKPILKGETLCPVFETVESGERYHQTQDENEKNTME